MNENEVDTIQAESTEKSVYPSLLFLFLWYSKEGEGSSPSPSEKPTVASLSSSADSMLLCCCHSAAALQFKNGGKANVGVKEVGLAARRGQST